METNEWNNFLSSFKQFFSEVVTAEFYDQGVRNRECLRNKNSLDTSLTFVDTEIQLSAFLQLLQPQTTNDVGGLRFYPSYDGNKMYLLMEDIQDDAAPSANPEYYILKNPFYATLPNKESKAIVEPNFIKYFEDIRIDGLDQVNTDDNCKRARFYKWDDLYNDLVASNQIEINAPDSYTNYKLRIEIGYITKLLDYICSSVYGRELGRNIGLTMFLSIIEPNGNRLTTLEIGSPCPPDGATLTW